MTPTPHETHELEGRRALVIGGTRGIGRAISLELARAGARLLVTHGRDRAAAEAFQAEAVAESLAIETLKSDVTSEKGRQELLSRLDAEFPALDVLVYCAATGVHKPLTALSERHFDFTFNLNVKAFFWLLQTLGPRFSSGASIIALSSEGAVHAMHEYSLTGASKAALESLVRHAAAELGPRGVRVNVLSPGAVRTDAWNALPDAAARLADAANRAPLRRLASLEEVASVARFLAGPASSAITAQTLVVDCGARVIGRG